MCTLDTYTIDNIEFLLIMVTTHVTLFLGCYAAPTYARRVLTRLQEETESPYCNVKLMTVQVKV